ncbi:MAG: cysteine peptidase family C39 domain-containing protein [Coprobacillus sp.]|nr:cysteine peptidase family C39 domain-containing protein [Coprobacillus sp.]
MYFVKQETTYDCLFTCLKILLASCYREKKYLYLARKKDEAYSFYDVKEIGQEYGVELVGYQTEEKDLSSFKDQTIILSINKDGRRHAVILHKVGKKRCQIIDPSIGRLRVRTSLLLEWWDRTFLLLENKSLLENSSLQHRHRFTPNDCSTLSLKGRGLDLYLYKFLSSLFIILGLFFVTSTYFLLPICFFALFALFEVLYQVVLIKKMKEVDNLFFLSLKHPLHTKEELKTYEEYKSQLISLPVMSMYAMLVALFLTFLLAYNSLYNLIFVGVVFLFALVKRLFLSHQTERKKREIDNKEDDLFKQESIEEFKKSLSSLHTEVYSYTYQGSIYNYIELFFLILAIILSMYLQHILSLSYVLLYFATSYYLKENIDKITSLPTSLSDYTLVKSKYSTLIYHNQHDTKKEEVVSG